MEEKWVNIPIEGFEHYLISNTGKIKLPKRDVLTHIKNHGKDMLVTAHRKEYDVIVQYEKGKPLVRLQSSLDNKRKKMSLALLMLKTFKLDECPSTPEKCISVHLDGDSTNNSIDNLQWLQKSEQVLAISKTLKGEHNASISKYKNIIIKVHDIIVGYAEDSLACTELFNSYGLDITAQNVSRNLKSKARLLLTFSLECVPELEYKSITENLEQQNLKIIYDILETERKLNRRIPKTITKKETIVKEKIVPKVIIKKEVVYKNKIVYRNKPTKKVETTKPKVEKPKTDVKKDDFINNMMKFLDKKDHV